MTVESYVSYLGSMIHVRLLEGRHRNGMKCIKRLALVNGDVGHACGLVCGGVCAAGVLGGSIQLQHCAKITAREGLRLLENLAIHATKWSCRVFVSYADSLRKFHVVGEFDGRKGFRVIRSTLNGLVVESWF